MALMGVQINGAGSDSSTRLADTLAKAFFGDPELDLKLARGRQEMESEAWRRRVWEAQAAHAQSVADTETYEREARQRNVPTVQDYYAGLVEEPVPVEVPDVPVPVPSPRPDMPVPIDLTPTGDPAVDLGRAAAEAVGEDYRQQMPVPVDPNAAIMPEATGEPLPEGAPAPVDQVLPGPQPDIPVTQAQRDAYQREVDARRAEAELIIAGGGTANQMAQGLGIGEGIIKSESTDPTTRTQGELLYTGDAGKTSAAVGGKAAQELRKEIQKLPAYSDFADVQGVYSSMVKSAKLNTKAAFMDLIYGIATLEDPGSVVREADALMVKRTGGLSGDVQSLLSYFTEKGELTPTMKANLMEIAANRYHGYRDAFNQQTKQYRDIAARQGLDLRDVIPEFENPEDYMEQLPPGVTEDQIARVLAANPILSRELAIKRVLELQAGGR